MNVPSYNHALATFEDRIIESGRFHMGTGKVHETLKALAADLDRVGIDYVVVGAMALNAFGFVRETTDVDVLVRGEGLDRFHSEYDGKGYLPSFSGARKTFRNTRTGVAVEFITAGEFPGDGLPKPVAFPNPGDVAIDVNGVKVVKLPVLVELKLASGMTQPARRRDLADVQDLIRTLGLDEDFVELLDPFVRETYMTLLGELRVDDPHRERPS